MRFLRASVFALGLLSLSSSSVSARCLGDTDIDQEYKPLKGGTPSPLAVPLYWTNAPVNGNLGGLAGADLTCQTAALFSGIPLLADKYELFKAILSTRTIDARDRFAAVTPPDTDPIDTQFDVVTSNNECLMDSVYYLFQGNLNLNSDLPAEDGTFASDTIEVFTGTKGDGTKWYVPGVDSSNDKIINSAYCSTSLSSSDQGWTSSNTNPSGTDNTVIDPMIGRMFNALSNNDRMWLGGQNKGCGNGLHLLCLQAAPSPTQPPSTPPPTNPPTNPPTPGGAGDPQFTGLQGQSFQVHGMPDEFFNLISLPDMQLNSRFAYLASGRCNYNNTECWTHPGTYVDQLGFMFPGLFIKAVAGTHDDGMSVFVNDKRISAATGADSVTQHTIRGHTHGLNDTQIVTVTYTRHDQLIIAAPLFTVTATNSDMFFNFGVSLHSPSLLSAGSAVHHVKSSSVSAYPSFPLHGLLGQTWKNARYSNGRFFQGTVDDYMLLDAQLFSTKFVFNQYKH